MRGFPQELIFALLFGAVLLVQFLYRELRKKAATMQAEPEADIPPDAAASTPVPADTVPRFTTVRIAAPPPAPLRSPPRSLPRARRFSRTALMPDRRAVQDAVVIAAILQPCHAHKARDIE